MVIEDEVTVGVSCPFLYSLVIEIITIHRPGSFPIVHPSNMDYNCVLVLTCPWSIRYIIFCAYVHNTSFNIENKSL